jgi:hypothetical protein
VGDELYENWEHDDRVEIIHILDDIGQPYSCSQWGETGAWEDSNGNGIKDEGEIPKTIPPIIDDGSGYTIFEWFENQDGEYPMIVFIDHTKTVFNILYVHSPAYLTIANLTIETMLNAMPAMSTSIDDNTYFIDNFNIAKLYPNPFNPVLHINFDIAWSGVIQVDILDISGSHIKTLHSGFLQSGSHELSWNAESMPSGVYLVSLQSDDKTLTEKVVLLK